MKSLLEKKSKQNESRIGMLIPLVSIFWTVLVLLLGGWNWHQQIDSIDNIAHTVARDSYNKDVLFRDWATGHGGVYVPVTASTPPNKYLTQIPERDIVTPSGRKLTLVNPAYMTRQVYELSEKKYGTRGHITSLNPIRPENSPDEWEKRSLIEFENGKEETQVIAVLGDQKYFRLMRPLITKTGCLRCHAEQGYKEGDIRGGISVSIPWQPFDDAYKEQLRVLIAGYIGVWLAGLTGIIFISGLIRRYLWERKIAEDQISSLLQEKELLLKEVHHRIKNNMNTIKGLLFLQADSLKDSSAIAVLQDAENRVESMMVLYDKLYRSDNFRELSVKKYLPVLVNEIVSNFSNRGVVTVEESIDNFMIEADILFPLGIIVNEIITNIMKYAFTGRDSGLISVSASLNKSHVTIEIHDNGIGISESVDINDSSGFGMQLIRILTEQIGGHIRIVRGGGTRFILEFDV